MSLRRITDVGAVINLVALVAFGIFAAAGGLGGDSTSASGQNAREASCLAGSEDCKDTGGGALGVCAPGVTDCVDTVVGGGNSTDQICIPPEEGGPEDCKDGGSGGGVSVNPVCAPDHPNCSDMCVVSSNGDVNCTGGGSDGGSGSSEPGSPGQVDPYTCAAPGECEKLAIQAAWSLLESDGVKGEISLVSVKAVEWPDSCLGNDNREIACAEVITPGFIVILQRNGVEYEFHTDTNGRAVGAP